MKSIDQPRHPLGWFHVVSILVMTVAFGAYLEATQAPGGNFTGSRTRLEDETSPSIVVFRFDPGSRTRWHSHEKGQIILVEEGVALVQDRGGPVVELRAGEIMYCPPDVIHWHGAAADEGGVQYNVTRGGITWHEFVTDEEYAAAARP